MNIYIRPDLLLKATEIATHYADTQQINIASYIYMCVHIYIYMFLFFGLMAGAATMTPRLPQFSALLIVQVLATTH